MSDLTNIQFFDSHFDEQIVDDALKYLSKPRWRFGYYDSDDKPHKKYWVSPLSEYDIFSKKIYNLVTQSLSGKYSLLEVYAAGHTYGMNGSLCTANDPDIYFVMIFLNKQWDIEWGGKTILVQEDGKYEAIFPKPGSMIVFPSDLYFYSEDICREFYGLKITLIYKLRKVG